MKQITAGRQNDIFKRATLLIALNEKITPHLPSALQGHVKVANYRQGCLVLAVDNAAIATQLRYLTSDLLTTLRHDAKLFDLANIKFYIQPPEEPTLPPTKPMKISENAARTLRELAESLPEDSPLRASLLKMGSRDKI